MYAYHTLFSEDRRSFDDGRFWFQDALHSPEPFCPFDVVWFDYGGHCSEPGEHSPLRGAFLLSEPSTECSTGTSTSA